MNIADFSRENLARCTSPKGFNHPLEDWRGSDWLCALVGEIGETANVVKKLNRIRDGIRNTESCTELLAALSDEIADTYCYLDLTMLASGHALADQIGSDGNDLFQARGLVFCAQHDDPTASDIICLMAKYAGRMAGDGGRHWSFPVSAANLLDSLCALARYFDIDLSAAIRTKFDKVSAKIGYVAEAATP